MYSALWRILPGHWTIRLIILLALVVGVLYCLATWVYPWVDSIVNPVDAVIEQ